jgi:serine/threonine-protein kinase RsbW
MAQANEVIQLSLPLNATYVSAARLTASNIAYKMGFDIDGIEDVKAAVSEACAYVIKKAPAPPSEVAYYLINFELSDSELEINLNLSKDLRVPLDEEFLGITMIKALADELDFQKDGEFLTLIKLRKKKTQSLFDDPEGARWSP